MGRQNFVQSYNSLGTEGSKVQNTQNCSERPRVADRKCTLDWVGSGLSQTDRLWTCVGKVFTNMIWFLLCGVELIWIKPHMCTQLAFRMQCNVQSYIFLPYFNPSPFSLQKLRYLFIRPQYCLTNLHILYYYATTNQWSMLHCCYFCILISWLFS